MTSMFFRSLGAVWRGTMIAIGVAAGIPARAGDVRSHAHPAATFGDAVARAERMVTQRDADAAIGGETIFLNHGRRTARAVVLFHGLTDSPRQFADLADSLFADGDNVLVPRLPRHSIQNKDVRELKGLTPGELCRFADETIDVAAGLGDSVIVMGLSIGGTLAAWTAEHRPEVRRAIVIAPALEVVARSLDARAAAGEPRRASPQSVAARRRRLGAPGSRSGFCHTRARRGFAPRDGGAR